MLGLRPLLQVCSISHVLVMLSLFTVLCAAAVLEESESVRA